MSEIFRVLRKSREEQVKAPPRVDTPNPNAEPTVEVTPSVAQPEMPADVSPRFTFDTADRRIRDVLDPLTLPGEQFRLLRAKLNFIQKQQNIRTILVTSALPGEGKTFTATCLAGVLAQEVGRRVLLMDADLRRSRISWLLGINGVAEPPGLARVLEDGVPVASTLFGADGLDFHFIPSGPIPRNPSEILSSPRLEQLIAEVREQFDWVIVDSPPLLSTADSTVLAPLCDSVLLVVRANKTPSGLVLAAIERLGRAKVCGIVMNRVSHLRSSKYYYHYYRKRGKRRA